MNKIRCVFTMCSMLYVFSQPMAAVAAKQSAKLSNRMMAVLPNKKELGAACNVASVRGGSLEAALVGATLLEPAQGGISQHSYNCHGTPVTAYVFDFLNEKTAKRQLDFIGARLWGGPGPNVEHPDELLYGNGIIAVVSSTKPGELTRIFMRTKKLKRYTTSGVIGSLGGEVPSPEVDLSSDELSRIRGFIACDKAPERKVYCDLLDAFVKGKPMGSDIHAMAGITLRIDLDESFVPSIWTEEADYFVSSSMSAEYGTIRPRTPSESEGIEAFVSLVRNGKTVPADNPLMQFAERMLSSNRMHDTKQVGQSTVYGSNSKVYIRDCGAGIGVVETFRSGRLFYLGWFPKK